MAVVNYTPDQWQAAFERADDRALAWQERADEATRLLTRAVQLGEWIERDRGERDKVFTYAQELQGLRLRLEAACSPTTPPSGDDE